MDQYAVEALVAFGLVSALGLLAGLSRPKLPWAPTAIRWATVAGFAVLLAVVGAWVSACPSCTSFQSYDSTRALDLNMAFLWGGLFTLVILGLTWLGATVSWLVERWRGAAARHPGP